MHGKDKNHRGPGNLGKTVVTKVTNYTGLAGRHSETGLATALNAAASTTMDNRLNVAETQHKKNLHTLRERRKTMESSMLAYSERMRQIARTRSNDPGSKALPKGDLLDLKFTSSNVSPRAENGNIYRTKSLDFTHIMSPRLQNTNRDKQNFSENSSELAFLSNAKENSLRRLEQLPTVKGGVRRINELGDLEKVEKEKDFDHNVTLDIFISPPDVDETEPYPQIEPFPELPDTKTAESPHMNGDCGEGDYYKKERQTYVWKPQKSKPNRKYSGDASTNGGAPNPTQTSKQSAPVQRVRKKPIKPVISHHLFKYSEAVDSFLFSTSNDSCTDNNNGEYHHWNGNVGLKLNTEFIQSADKDPSAVPVSERRQLKGALSAPSLINPPSPSAPVNEEETKRRRVLSFSDKDRLHVFNSSLPVKTLHLNNS